MEPETVDVKAGADGGGNRGAMREIAASLHDLCQPLTALQCRLEMGQMFGTTEAYAEAISEALRESERLMVAVSAMRELVRRSLEQTEGSRWGG